MAQGSSVSLGQPCRALGQAAMATGIRPMAPDKPADRQTATGDTLGFSLVSLLKHVAHYKQCWYRLDMPGATF